MVSTLELESPQLQVATAPVELLARRCREEIARFRRGETCDDTPCLELFRRAVVEQDEACWQELHLVFHEQVLTWCRSTTCCSSADAEELVCVAWEKFWLNFTPAKLAAAQGSAGVLRYLKMCARSAAFDSVRTRRATLSLDDSCLERADRNPTPAEEHSDRDTRSRFWAIVNATLRDERERVIAHLSYEVGLKPAEIQARHADLFPSVVEVYQVTRNVLDRLKRNRELSSWFEQECG